METVSFYFPGKDGKEIYTKKWFSKEKPRAILQIAHGMAEHIERYSDFASFLTEKKIYVYGNDHRGHGKTEKREEDRGYFGDGKNFFTLVEDMNTLTGIIKNDYPDCPVFLLGHSMGSFLSRFYIQKFGGSINGVIFSGTGGHPGFLGKIGVRLASREAKKHGRRTPSLRLNRLTFGRYNRSVKLGRTDFDWLSRDDEQVDKYINDPLCGGVFTAGFFEDFISALNQLYDNDQKIPKELPVLFLSGDRDPVGKFTIGVLESFHRLQKAGLKKVSFKFYPGARHEILNEINKDEVYGDILYWIEEQLKND